ncbi:unnamed protein product [Urochloa humidicola]
MASSSSSSPGGGNDGPSTTGRSSERPQQCKEDTALQKLLRAVLSLDIVKARECAEKLKEMGKGLDEAVAELAIRNRKSRRHGPLHAAASTNLLSMCKMLVKDFN